MLVTLLALAAGCAVGLHSEPNHSTTDVVDESISGFEAFSGMTLPPAANDLDITASSDDAGRPNYLVTFELPTGQLDQFCRDGQMSRPLRVVTIPESTRETFDYAGDSSSGVRIGEASLPSNVAIQREVFATGTHGSVARVQVHAYAMGR
ncbi:MAG: hypothetical protein ABWZ98_18400 [Nakamurella sp.]